MKYKTGDFFKATQDNSPNGIASYTILNFCCQTDKYEVEYKFCNGVTMKNNISELIVDYELFNGYFAIHKTEVEPRPAFYSGYGRPEPVRACQHLNKKKVLMITSSFYLCESCGLDLGDT